ncbi:MAG: outer membrane protein transport protein [Ignavibacteria bacterium]|nr:outer membrane protein transport protein [Ignavibacteria bacterium]
MKQKLNTALCAFLLLCSTAFGSGFQINEHGARAMAMGGAFTAAALDPSILYFNNAGITQMSGFKLMMGSTLIAPSSTFRGVSPKVNETKMESQLFTPIHFYATYEITDQIYAGLGFNNPFGLGTKWPSAWDGRFVSLEIAVETYNLNPVIAYKINDNLSIGVGLQYAFGNVLINKDIKIPSAYLGETIANVDMNGDATSAMGFTAGLMYKTDCNLTFGVNYRSEVKFDFTGSAKSTGGSSLAASSLPSGDITASLTTPQQLVVGVSYQYDEKLLLSTDFQWVGWSSYDTLKVNFTSSNTSSAAPRLYENNYAIRFGANYKYCKDIDFSAGLLYDKNPVKDQFVDATLPDADRLGFSVGAGYKVMDNLSVDVSYLFLRMFERTITNSMVSSVTYDPNNTLPFNGTYNSTANLFSLSLSYNL